MKERAVLIRDWSHAPLRLPSVPSSVRGSVHVARMAMRRFAFPPFFLALLLLLLLLLR